ncbi:hypothetical protein [Aurantibacillus circumpalustris]|uniref:hypothetical protein n=1 Tax=Aurantibacillus circumpalustris TaxID=3036359 RepID=UPI00295C107F|nr:hypothetical protein [Aurantibacillus circumpalustris]
MLHYSEIPKINPTLHAKNKPFLQKLIAYFFSDYHLKPQIVWFKKLLYCYLIIECAYFLLYYDLLLGENSIVMVSPKSIGLFKTIPFILYNSLSPNLSLTFVMLTLGISLFGLFNLRFYFILDFLLYFLVINIHNRVYPTLTGGDNLLSQLLIFNCFLVTNFTNNLLWKDQLKICFHNFSLLAIVIQVSLLYFLSALAKLNDPAWFAGTAISGVAQIQYFSMYSFFTYSENLRPVFFVLNYVVLFYQLFFPILIWIKKVKKPFLIFGVLMHLYIAFVMGLVGFGFIMILAYVFFWPMKEPLKS